MIAKINLQAGLVLQFVNEFGIHACAGGSQRLKGSRSFQRAVDQHARRRMRSFAPGFSTFHHQNCQAKFAQRNRE